MADRRFAALVGLTLALTVLPSSAQEQGAQRPRRRRCWSGTLS